jgi:hypothetical protein
VVAALVSVTEKPRDQVFGLKSQVFGRVDGYVIKVNAKAAFAV